jgi:membrane peptidoglycan carboxypeptidase
MRRSRGKKYHNTPTQRGGFTLALFISLTILFIAYGLTIVYTIATRKLPSPETIALHLEPPTGFLLQPTRFYDRSGDHLIHIVENPAIQKRQYLPLNPIGDDPDTSETIPVTLVNATIAISDPTFWSNPGFLVQGNLEGSHNTLAQRLVSNILLWDEQPGIWREIRERVLAAQITTNYGRDKVMEWFLNDAHYGNLAYGVQAAAQVYFGKSVAKLNLAESAVLAAVAEAPALNPHDSPQTALARGKVVLEAMAGQGLITEDEAKEASIETVKFQEPIPHQDLLAPAFINLAWERLSKDIPIARLERGGFNITTSLDYDLQTQISCTTQIHLARIQSGGNTSTTADYDSCPSSQLLPTFNLDVDSTVRDTLGTDLSANVIVVDPISGQILAMVVETPSGIVGSSMKPHPPGSLATPFIYLTAFTRGFNPASLVWDIPLDQPGLPSDPTRDYEGPLRLRNAFVNDNLNPAIQVIHQVGLENILQTARQLGLTSLSIDDPELLDSDCPGCQFVMHGGEITLLEAAQAFGAFANQGFLVGKPSGGIPIEGLDPLSLINILDVHDRTNRTKLTDEAVQSRPVISNQLAYLMTDILSDETARWVSLGHPNPLEIGRPAGVKMGRTASGLDVWTVGFTPKLVVGVWMGVPDESEITQLPSKAASTLWHAVIQSATQDTPAESWYLPSGVTNLDICDPSGMLPTLQCPSIVSEVFLSGQEPTQPDTLYKSYQINQETGRLATVFTPPALIEERIYLNIPPEASAWANSINLDTPPETYDVIYTPSMPLDAQIEVPSMFDFLSGVVTIRGTASGENFEAYRIQAGEGLNPSGWTVVEGENFSPVESGILGTWDTTNLNGLFALQLIVLRLDQRVDTTTIQVTLDNLPPEVEIPYPKGGDTFNLKADKIITFLVNASDNLGLSIVEFYIDNEQVASQVQPPFAFPWQTRIGKHVLTVKVFDRAGNSAKASVTFRVE